MRVIQDGVRAMILPECAKCILEEKYPNDFEECPIWKCDAIDECDPDCEFYTEEWEP